MLGARRTFLHHRFSPFINSRFIWRDFLARYSGLTASAPLPSAARERRAPAPADSDRILRDWNSAGEYSDWAPCPASGNRQLATRDETGQKRGGRRGRGRRGGRGEGGKVGRFSISAFLHIKCHLETMIVVEEERNTRCLWPHLINPSTSSSSPSSPSSFLSLSSSSFTSSSSDPSPFQLLILWIINVWIEFSLV